MEYLLKASGIIGILFLFYQLFLKKETFFNSIRAYFILGLLITIAFPLIEIPIYIETVTTKLNVTNIQTSIIDEPISEKINWLQLLILGYLAGVVFFSIKFLIQLISLIYFISKHQLIKSGSYYFIETAKNCSPFSFFNIIIYNKNQFSKEELTQILNHEKAHVTQWHSLDTLLAHILVITLWFNPFVWLYKKAVLQNLEFLADAFAIKNTENHKFYQLTLLKTCNTNFCTEITNNFYNSLIKKRIIMLHQNKSTNKNQFKYLLLLPILVGFLMTFNTKIIAQETTWTEKNSTIIELIIDKNTSDADLNEEAEKFKNELNIDLNFKGIKRNNNNEIVAIKIDAKGENVKANFQNNGTEAINPILITYNSENNSISIGNVTQNNAVFTVKNPSGKEANYVFVNSNGDKTSWTSKNIDSVITKDKIIINGDHIWVEKDGDNKEIEFEVITEDVSNGKKIKVIKNGEEINLDESENTFIIKEDNASENIIIIKNTDGNNVIKEEKTISFRSKNSNEKPLYILNGEEISAEKMNTIDKETIESIDVLKGENAVKKYGEKAENGVIIITTKQ